MKERIFWLGMAALTVWWLIHWSYPSVWPYNHDGSPKLIDFTVFWTGAKEILSGHANVVYDAPKFYDDEAAFLARSADQAIGFTYPYPPSSFLFVWPLGLLPYTVAFVSMQALGLSLWTAVLHRITKDWIKAACMALAAGGATFSIEIGQNGLFTAALLLGSLIALPRDKRSSGILLGLLTFKPHLAAAAFLGLALWREWRALAWAVATAGAMIVLATAIFGFSIWFDFLRGNAHFVEYLNTRLDMTVRNLMQSVFAIFAPHNGIAFGLAVQVCVGLSALFVTKRIRGTDQRSAALIAATMLVTPFSFLYDLTALIGAAALLLRNTRKGYETFAICAIASLPATWLFSSGQIGPMTAFLMLGVAFYQSEIREEASPELQRAD